MLSFSGSRCAPRCVAPRWLYNLATARACATELPILLALRPFLIATSVGPAVATLLVTCKVPFAKAHPLLVASLVGSLLLQAGLAGPVSCITGPLARDFGREISSND